MLETLVTNTLHDPLAAARLFRQAGGRVIGYVGAEIPVELIIASGAMPLQVPVFDVKEITLANRYLENSFEPTIRAAAERYLRGDLDFLDAIVFPRSNDSAQRLYYYLCELRRTHGVSGPPPLIYDLAKIPRDSSRAYSEQATRRLAKILGVEESRLPKAIALRNRRRELMAAADDARIRQRNVQGSFIDRVFRIADFCDRAEFDIALSGWLESNREKGEIHGPRLLLAGSAPSDERLHLAVESAGGNVVAELGDFAAFSAQLPLIPEDGSCAALAAHYCSLPHGPRAFIDRAEVTLACARNAQVDGVILWLLEQEEAVVWDVPAQQKALASAGIPTLSLVRRCWDVSDGALDDIVSFTKDLKRQV